MEPQIAFTPLNTAYGTFTFYVFSWSENEQDNVLVLESSFNENPLVRIQSACYSGEIFKSLDCDCHWQLDTSLESISKEGGLFIYMLRDGRGAGLLAKIRGMALTSEEGLDTAAAYERLGVPLDPRAYGQAVYVLKYFRCSQVRLLTNNPRKTAGLEKAGLMVTRVPLQSVPTDLNRAYLFAKINKLGHLMSFD